jgi:hypothetical protein
MSDDIPSTFSQRSLVHTKLNVGIVDRSREVQEIGLIVVILLFVLSERVIVFRSCKDSIGTFTLLDHVGRHDKEGRFWELTVTPSNVIVFLSMSTPVTLCTFHPSDASFPFNHFSWGLPTVNRTWSPGRMFHLAILSLGWTNDFFGRTRGEYLSDRSGSRQCTVYVRD